LIANPYCDKVLFKIKLYFIKRGVIK